MLLLRPHHINCMFFCRGLGYSEDFNKEMNKIIQMPLKFLLSDKKLYKKRDLL